MKVPFAAMVNILGKGDGDIGMDQTLEPCIVALGLESASIHMYGKKLCKKGRKMGHVTITGDTLNEVLDSVSKLTEFKNTQEPRPLVGIIMGSYSDLPVMKPAAEILNEFKVPYEITIVSAHRTPDRMRQYGKEAHKRGLQVIIAGAGGAAHLPGMIAAYSSLPVIGVPVALKHLDGVDSLHSIVQMPRGVPVAAVAINNATNAALLAVRILGCSGNAYQERLNVYRAEQERHVMEDVHDLNAKGIW